MKIFRLNPFVFTAIALIIIMGSCQKQSLEMAITPEVATAPQKALPKAKITGNTMAAISLKNYTKYIIYKGLHDCTPKPFRSVKTTLMKYSVIFDSTCIYTSVTPSNQADINKLFGFSDNNAFHQQFSARIGWRWYGGQLELLAYVYNFGTWTYAPITPVSIGQAHTCSIRVSGGSYIFNVNSAPAVTMSRGSKTSTAQGYQLYPYFGGDEVAPRNINIWMCKL